MDRHTGLKKFRKLVVGYCYWTRGRERKVRITGTTHTGDGRTLYIDDSGKRWLRSGRASSIMNTHDDLIWWDPVGSFQGNWTGLTKTQVKVVMEARA